MSQVIGIRDMQKGFLRAALNVKNPIEAIMGKLFSDKIFENYIVSDWFKKALPSGQVNAINLPKRYLKLFWETLETESVFFKDAKCVSKDSLIYVDNNVSVMHSSPNSTSTKMPDFTLNTVNPDILLVNQLVPILELEGHSKYIVENIVKKTAKNLARVLDKDIVYCNDANFSGLVSNSTQFRQWYSDDVPKKMLRMFPVHLQKDAVWYCNRNTGREFAETLPGYCSGRNMPTKLLSLPIIYNDEMCDLREDGCPLILINRKHAFELVFRKDVSVRRFYNSYYSELDSVLLVFRVMLGMKVFNPKAVMSFIPRNY